MTHGPEAGDMAQIPTVVGEEIMVPDELDETFGLPNEVAAAVAAQVLAVLEGHSIDPTTVVFSGYDDAANEGHEQKAEGEFARMGEDSADAHQYFFAGVQDLADGEEGPLAYAATGNRPMLGVYDLNQLVELGYDDGSVIATPDQVLATQVLQFVPTYRRPEAWR